MSTSGSRSSVRRPIIESMLKFHQGPLNVRVRDVTFFRELIKARPSSVKILVERKGQFVDVGRSNVVYDSAQQGTGLPRIMLLPEHQQWILEAYGDRPVGKELLIEHGDEPFTFVLRNPDLAARS